jgi:hypothetical protein
VLRGFLLLVRKGQELVELRACFILALAIECRKLLHRGEIAKLSPNLEQRVGGLSSFEFAQ